MPILDSSIKAARQNVTRKARRLPYRTAMKTHLRKVRDLVQEGKMEEAIKALPLAFKAIDTAAKKKIIHKKNAANKKSLLSRLTNPRKK